MVDTRLVLKPIIYIIAFVEYTGNNFVVQLQCRLKVIDQMRWSDEWLCCRSVCMVRAEFRLSGGYFPMIPRLIRKHYRAFKAM